jgi:HEAT repeat protein
MHDPPTMKLASKTRLKIGIACGVGVLMLLGLGIAQLARSGPRYKGRTVWEMASLVRLRPEGYSYPGRGAADIQEAFTGLRALGDRADAVLIKGLQTKDSSWRRLYSALWSRYPNLARAFHLQRPWTALLYRQTAVQAIGKVGRVTPQIERALVQACYDPDPVVRECAACIVGYRGSNNPDSVRAVESALADKWTAGALLSGPAVSLYRFDFAPRTVADIIADLDRPYFQARYLAADALSKQGAQAQPAVPALIRLLNDPNQQVRGAAIRALGAIGPAASNAVPALEAKLSDESKLTQEAARAAIKRIKPTGAR